jgi:uncharacterized protein YjbI with pentapeptide repeats
MHPLLSSSVNNTRPDLEKNLNSLKKSTNISKIRSSTLLYATLRYATLLYSTLRYSTLRYSTLRYANLRYSTQLYANLRYSTLFYSTLSRFRTTTTDTPQSMIIIVYGSILAPPSLYPRKKPDS